MLKLHWSPKSPYVRKVMMVLHELNALESVELMRSVAAMTAPNERLMFDNPLSKIPTLVREDGSTLFDSEVICEYLNHRFEGNLFPKVGEERWQTLRWHALGDGLLDALILWRNERERELPSQKLIDAFDLKVSKCLSVLEKEVHGIHACGFDIGAITLVCALGYIDYRFESLSWSQKAPKLYAWYSQMQHRPSVKSTMPVDG